MDPLHCCVPASYFFIAPISDPVFLFSSSHFRAQRRSSPFRACPAPSHVKDALRKFRTILSCSLARFRCVFAFVFSTPAPCAGCFSRHSPTLLPLHSGFLPRWSHSLFPQHTDSCWRNKAPSIATLVSFASPCIRATVVLRPSSGLRTYLTLPHLSCIQFGFTL